MRSTARPIMRSALLRGAPSAFGAAAAFRPRMLSGTAGSRTLLGLLVERSPQITPDLHDWERTEDERKERLEALHKVSPAALTMSEESPDQERARKRMEQLVEREGSREGEGDRTGDLTSLDRRLAQRLYLLVRTGDEWQLPQREWAGAPQTAREALEAAVVANCGSELKLHAMGNAPLGHLPDDAGSSTLFVWRYLHVSGQVVKTTDIDEYAWLTKDELCERVAQPLGALCRDICGPFD
jgi:hypothetical protein